ncbi:MAG TPA: Gfo/Idh/MocA family oxidoreductase [Vicinamibacteria bacterium]|nr:Gfo/Idh/MocA family oxidoreductase [Vicinamibacteria bacterium]
MVAKARGSLSRREFGKTVAAAGVGLAIPAPGVFASGSETVRVAVVGCGERGTTDAVYCLKSAPGVELVAIADLFQDKVDSALEKLRAEVPSQLKVPPERIFLGFDAYKKVLALDDVNLVMLLTPPGFRPEMVAAGVEAGKHLFVEKPGAVDPVGVRSLIEASARAAQKGLSLVVGTQQRYAPQYLELVQRIRDGQIGELTHLEALWIGDMELWHYHDRQPSWSDMEWQVRCWPLFTWLSGDHYVEQLVHNLDVVNWIADATPVVCQGIGGRQVRTGTPFGNIFDHFAVRYEYKNGLTMFAMATQIRGVSTRVGNVIHGTKGTAHVDRGTASITGAKPWEFDGVGSSGDLEMHAALIRSIREGKPINEGVRLAEATMTGVMGRMSAYTGRALKWDWAMKGSKLDLRPSRYEMGPLPVGPVAMPGRTPLV